MAPTFKVSREQIASKYHFINKNQRNTGSDGRGLALKVSTFVLFFSLFLPSGNLVLYAQNSPVNCEACKNLNDLLNQKPTESVRRKELLEKLLGVLAELAGARERFTSVGDFKDIFPAAYYHVTSLEMQNILSNKYSYPAEKMEMMLKFYDSYRQNRAAMESGANANIEPHWANYYRNAQSFNAAMRNSSIVGLIDGNRLFNLITAGIDAHVNFDLPRSIRSTYQNTIPTSASRPQLRNEFLDTNNLFGTALQETNRDISQAFSRSQLLIPRDWVMDGAAKLTGAASKVVAQREGAFRLAQSPGNLPTARPQPVTNHQSLIQKGRAILEKLKKACEPCSCSVEISVNVIGGKPTGTERGIIAGRRAMLWDVSPFAPPDIVVCITEGRSGPRCTEECPDSYSCVFSGIILSEKVFNVQIIDMDLMEHDLIGSGSCGIDRTCKIGQAQVAIKETCQ